MSEVQINLNACDECPHVSHSGAFTEGGARPCCDHKDAVESFTKHRNIKGDYKYHWKHRVIKKINSDGTLKIPMNCPLR